MNWTMVFSGMACLLAIDFARYKDRTTLKAAIALFIGFLCYITAWAPWDLSPRDTVFALTGEKIKSAVFWAVFDYMVLLYIASIAIDRKLGLLLAFTYLIQVCLHVFRIYDMIPAGQHQLWLDFVFRIQILIFVVPNLDMWVVAKVLWVKKWFGRSKDILRRLAS